MAVISFNIACKELKIAQIAQLNQLFQRLHLRLSLCGGQLFFYHESHLCVEAKEKLGTILFQNVYRSLKLTPGLLRALSPTTFLEIAVPV